MLGVKNRLMNGLISIGVSDGVEPSTRWSNRRIQSSLGAKQSQAESWDGHGAFMTESGLLAGISATP